MSPTAMHMPPLMASTATTLAGPIRPSLVMLIARATWAATAAASIGTVPLLV